MPWIKKTQRAQTQTLPPALVVPPVRYMRVSCWQDGQFVTPTDGILMLDSDPPRYLYAAAEAGRLAFALPADVPYTWGATLTVANVGAWTKAHSTRVVLASDYDLTLPPAVAPLPRLMPLGGYFRGVDGSRFTARGLTSFQLYQRYLHDEDIDPVLAQAQELGANVLRVFGTCQFMFPFRPADYGDRYYSALPDFAAKLGQFGQYLEFTAFADTQIVMPDRFAQLDHWTRAGEALRSSPNVFGLELVNEYSQHDNRVTDLSVFLPIPGVLCAHGSNGASEAPVRPAWDYETFHWNDASEWWRKVGHNPMEEGYQQTGKPGYANENTRFPDRDNSAAHAYDAARAAALLCVGSLFHCVAGKTAQVITDPTEYNCAHAWFDGAKSVPLEFQDGFYRHESGMETPDLLRVYSKTLNDGRSFLTSIRK